MSRRATLGLLGLGGLAFLNSGAAGAKPPNGEDKGKGTSEATGTKKQKGRGNAGGAVYNWRRDVDASGHSLSNLGSLSMAENEAAITDFEGENLSIDGDGTLNATAAADTSKWEDADGDGLLEAPGFDGIDVSAVANTDGALDFEAGGERALRLEPTESGFAVNVVAGHPDNAVESDVHGAVIAGGGSSFSDEGDQRQNEVLHYFGTVGGGAGNTAGDSPPANAAFATVGGGRQQHRR